VKVFVDTNVLLDVLLERREFFADSASVWTLAEWGRIRGLVSAVSLTNIYYITSRLEGQRTAVKAVKLVRDSFHSVSCDDQIINQAIGSGIKDFEDAVQYCSALRAGADCLVSRDPKHFRGADLAVLAPGEFLLAHVFDEEDGRSCGINGALHRLKK
jgi:predicted nucleic acid-binding protein